MRGFALISVVLSAFMLFTPYYYLAPLPALGLLALLLLFQYPVVGFYIIAFLIPFAAFRKIGPINIQWLISIPVFIVFAFMFMKNKRLPDVVKSNLWPVIGLYLVTALLSTLFANYPEAAWKNMVLLIAGYSFVFMGMVCLSPNSYRFHIPRIIIWSVGLSSTMAFLDHFLGWSIFSEDHLSGNLTRSTGGSFDPNNLSVMILFAIPLVIHRALFATSKGERIAMLVILPIMLLTITTTFSRSGFLVTIVTLVLLLHHYRHYFRPKILGFLLLFGFAGSIAFFSAVPESFWERQYSLLTWEDSSLDRRATYLTVGGEAFVNRPFIGSGPGSFRDIYAESEISRKFAFRQSDRFRKAHNTYLEVLVGTGIFGFIFFIALNVRAFYNFRIAEKDFLTLGNLELANLVASQRIGFLTLLIFLLSFSELYHKFMLLSLVLSQGAIYFSQRRNLESRHQVTDNTAAVSTI